VCCLNIILVGANCSTEPGWREEWFGWQAQQSMVTQLIQDLSMTYSRRIQILILCKASQARGWCGGPGCCIRNPTAGGALKSSCKYILICPPGTLPCCWAEGGRWTEHSWHLARLREQGSGGGSSSGLLPWRGCRTHVPLCSYGGPKGPGQGSRRVRVRQKGIWKWQQLAEVTVWKTKW
jgi:hypothetical protein